MGRAPASVIAALMRLLTSAAGRVDGWTFFAYPEISAPPGAPNDLELIDLDEFARLWTERPMPGGLQFGDSVKLAAPAYADSVILSGPGEIVDLADTHGLEALAVSRTTALPQMTW